MAKKETTSFSVSEQLKTALATKGLLGSPDVNQVYFNGSNETHLLLSDMSDGTYRCIIKSTSGVDFDFHSIDDQTYIRQYAVRELTNMIGTYPLGVISGMAVNTQGANHTVTITHNGTPRIGTSQNIADAHALAFIQVLNNS